MTLVKRVLWLWTKWWRQFFIDNDRGIKMVLGLYLLKC